MKNVKLLFDLLFVCQMVRFVHVARLNNVDEGPPGHGGNCPKTGVCVPFVQCSSHFHRDTINTCQIVAGRKAICCKIPHNYTDLDDDDDGKFRARLVTVDAQTLGKIARRSRVEMAELRSREAQLLAAGQPHVLPPSSASYGHYRNSRMFNMEELSDVMDTASRALEIAIATRMYRDREGVTEQQMELGMIRSDLRQSPFRVACRAEPYCEQEPHRRIDGACNNLAHPTWGAALTPYTRLLPPSYQDGVWVPRNSEERGQPLTSPRLISTTLFPDVDAPNPDYTLMVMQFGQFLSHDITQSIDTAYQNGTAVSCCTSDGTAELPPHSRHYACMPIAIPDADPFYSHFGQKCMNFMRSVLAPNHECSLGHAQQMNKITHFIDGSVLYGSAPEQTGELRTFQGGRLAVFHDFGRDLLPLTRNPDACVTMEQGSACFTSGDTRTNQMISLVVLHVIFMREHNRVADILARLNPMWDDEKLFLETRRIVVAELQVITYKEFLPTLLGQGAMDEFQLNLGENGDYATDYDERVEPSIVNEFAAAAFRFGHSTVDGLLKIYGMTKMEEMIAIPEVMFNPGRMRKKQFLDEILSTLTTEPIQNVDNSISDALTKYMFRAGNPFGVDLASLNIQRGRDHGIKPYNDYRQLVGLPRIKYFEEFGPELEGKLRTVYASTDDIDLWVGGLLEVKAAGAIVGPTFRDIMADQFFRLKKGDRYFFENHPAVNPGYFEAQQLAELRRASMARLICDNRDGILLARQAPNAFRKPGTPGNEFVNCDDPIIPKVNLIYWQQ